MAPIEPPSVYSQAHFFFVTGAFFFVSTVAVFFFGAHLPQDMFEPPLGFIPSLIC
jgi:hypothetical protein